MNDLRTTLLSMEKDLMERIRLANQYGVRCCGEATTSGCHKEQIELAQRGLAALQRAENLREELAKVRDLIHQLMLAVAPMCSTSR